jgi:hypothetical protein
MYAINVTDTISINISQFHTPAEMCSIVLNEFTLRVPY